MTNAINNSLINNPSGQPQDGPMGISIALSPTSNNPSFLKHAITNASFRAKKLPGKSRLQSHMKSRLQGQMKVKVTGSDEGQVYRVK